MPHAALRPDPTPVLEAAFLRVLREHMQDMPMVNPALSVEAVGFQPWSAFWLGVLVTPWFMNILLMPREPAAWQPIPERACRRYVFPAGVFEFIGARHALLGDYQACSLFSPMFEFDGPETARATALAALNALLDDGKPQPEIQAVAADASKRRFLFGSSADAARSH
jgi:[NiFe] hydrogenase assembly HybE family chaperone